MFKIDNTRDLIIDVQSKLTSYPAISPSSGGTGEYDKAKWLESYLIQIGFNNIEHIDCPDERVPSGIRPNLACKIKGKSEQTLWLISHLDVVPVGDISLWNTDPYTLEIDKNDNDIIIGRGVEDNQQAIVIALLVAQNLIANNITPSLSLGLLFVADEETSSRCGIDYVLKNRPDLIKQNDLVLIQDFGVATSDKIEIAEKGVLWLKVTLLGEQCHASMPEKGHNTLLASAELILKSQELYNIFNYSDELFDPKFSTFVPTKIEANVDNINTIPGKDVFYIDCRVMPNYTFQQVIEKLQELAKPIAQKYSVEVSVEIAHQEPAVKGTDTNSNLVNRLKKAIKEVYKVDAKCFGAGGATVASFLRHKNIDAVVWGTFIPNFHTPNEKSKISHHINDAKVVTQIVI